MPVLGQPGWRAGGAQLSGTRQRSAGNGGELFARDGCHVWPHSRRISASARNAWKSVYQSYPTSGRRSNLPPRIDQAPQRCATAKKRCFAFHKSVRAPFTLDAEGVPETKNFCMVNGRYRKYEPIFVFRKPL